MLQALASLMLLSSLIKGANSQLQVLDLDRDGRIDCEDAKEWMISLHPGWGYEATHCTNISVPADAPPVLNGSHPVEIHTSLASSTSISVIWVTQVPTPQSTLFVIEPNGTQIAINGSIRTYNTEGWQGVIHEALFPPLGPNQNVTYRVGSSVAWSRWLWIVTPPASGQTRPDRAVRIATFGDMGTYIPLGYQVCEQIADDAIHKPLDLVIHQGIVLGDLAYASTAVSGTEGDEHDDDDEVVGDELQFVWDVFGQQIEPIAAHVPYVTPVGNHEKFNNWSAYATRFRNPFPWNVDPQNLPEAVFWFAFQFGPVSFVCMSTEHDYHVGSPQYAWLESELAQADARRASHPWVIFIGHRPMYCSDDPEWEDHRPGAVFQTTIEPLMTRYKVDLYFCGHMHMYERVHPVRNGTVSQRGSVYVNPTDPIHVVQGNAGIFENLEFIEPMPTWSAFREGAIGYGRFEANATHLLYEALRLEDRQVMDAFSIVKA